MRSTRGLKNSNTVSKKYQPHQFLVIYGQYINDGREYSEKRRYWYNTVWETVAEFKMVPRYHGGQYQFVEVPFTPFPDYYPEKNRNLWGCALLELKYHTSKLKLLMYGFTLVNLDFSDVQRRNWPLVEIFIACLWVGSYARLVFFCACQLYLNQYDIKFIRVKKKPQDRHSIKQLNRN